MNDRELDAEAVRFQAEAFLQFYRRSGVPLREAFACWSRSKDFGRADLEAIEVEVLEP